MTREFITDEQRHKKRVEKMDILMYSRIEKPENKISPEELQDIMYEEEYRIDNPEVNETRSRECNCEYKTEDACPFGLKIYEYVDVDESTETELRKFQTNVRSIGKPIIQKEDSRFMCRGYWKLYLQD